MPTEPVKFPLRFEARVMLPVIGIMAVLLFATVGILRERFNGQVQTQTEDSLRHAELVFQSFQRQRSGFLTQGYVNLANEPRVKSIARLADPKTAQNLITNIVKELGHGTIFITRANGEPLASHTLDLALNLKQLEAQIAPGIEAALAGGPFTGLIHVGARIFDLTSVPIRLNEEIIGVISFVDPIGPETASEFKKLTGTEVVLFENAEIIASTLNDPDLEARLLEIFRGGQASPASTKSTPIQSVELGGKPFQVLVARMPALGPDKIISHLLLASREEPMRVLHATQSVLIAVSVIGMILSSAIIWMLVRTITRPLRQLREGAAAVGRGDFDHRVPVTSRDECGALAQSFNQMTDNLRSSRAELEQTVETLKTTREQLLQSEKLSAIGEFVAGVTHELNNPLTSVIGYADLARQNGPGQSNHLYLESIVSSAKRCHKIVQSLLSFARQHTPEKKAVDVNELIENTLNFVQYELRTSNVDVQRHLSTTLPKVWADPYQLQQVFLNIVNNARHAMEDSRKEGCLTVTTEATATHVRIRMQDNGPGIPAANLPKIFNPFFTTKAVGKGTGLGLSVTYGIIQEHGGSIRAESRDGEGAAFVIELPIMPSNMVTTAVPAPKAAVPAPTKATGKRILVIDDEAMILSLVQTSLTRDGYQVDAAPDGEAGLKLFRIKHYDLILCDWKMPGYNGREVFEQIKALKPEACPRVVFMTGDVINENIRKFHEDAGAACLSKPFSIDDLRVLIRKTIETNGAAKKPA